MFHFSLLPLPLFSQIAVAAGPCGNNRDYLFKLEKAMIDIGKYIILSLLFRHVMVLFDVLSMLLSQKKKLEINKMATAHISIKL